MASKERIREMIAEKNEHQKKNLRQQLSAIESVQDEGVNSKEVKLIYLNLAMVSLAELIEEVTNE